MIVVWPDQTTTDEVEDVTACEEVQRDVRAGHRECVHGDTAERDSRGGGQSDIVSGLGADKGVHKVVLESAGSAEGGDPESRDVGGEVILHQGPAADDVVRQPGTQRRVRIGVAVEVDDDDATEAADLAEVGRIKVYRRRRVRSLGEAGERELSRVYSRAACGAGDEGKAAVQCHGTDGLGRGGLCAAQEGERAAPQRNRRRVFDAVSEITKSTCVVDVERGIHDLDARGAGEPGAIAQSRGTAADESAAGVGVVRVERHGVVARTHEAQSAGQLAGPAAASVVIVHDQGARGGATGHNATCAFETTVGEKAAHQLGVAVEVERAARRDIEERIGDPRVVSAVEDDRAVVDVSVPGDGAGAAARDRAGRRCEGQRAAAGFHPARRTDDCAADVQRRAGVHSVKSLNCRKVNHRSADCVTATACRQNATG